jgi:hypothetical protein
LSKSDNVNEAATAAARAQKLIEQHRIDMAMLDEAPEDEDIVRGIEWVCFTVKKRTPSWKHMLLWAIAEANDAKPWSRMEYEPSRGYRREYYVIGRPSDCQHVQTLYAFIEGQIEYLVKKSKGHGRAWNNSFRLGAVTEIDRRFKQQRAEQRLKLEADAKDEQEKHPQSRALVRVQTALMRLDGRVKKVEHFMDYNDMRYVTGSAVTTSGGGFGAGRSAGAGIDISGGGRRSIGDS